MNIVTLARTSTIDPLYNIAPFVSASRPGTWTIANFWKTTFGVPDSSQAVTVDIVQVVIDSLVNLTETTLYADMLALPQSFFFDDTTQILYINSGLQFSPMLDAYAQGRAFGYCDGQLVYIDDIEYLPLVKTVGGISKAQDIKGYEKLSFQSGSITFHNVGGELDFLDSEIVTGNDIRVYYLDDEKGETQYTAADLVPLSSGYIDDYSLSLKEASINAMDKRKSGNIKIPVEVFSGTGNAIPLLYGTANTVEAFCTNPDDTTDPPVFRFCQAATSYESIQVEVSGVWTEKMPTAEDLGNGSFTLSVADGRNGGTPLKCRVQNAVGYDIDNALDIIEHLQENYLSIPYLESFYNTAEWETAKAAISNDIGLYIKDHIELYEVIRQLQDGDIRGFRFEVDRFGKYTARIDDPDRATSFYISSEDIQDIDNLGYETDTDPLTARVIVNYFKDHMEGNYLSEINDDNAAYVKETYRLQPTQIYNTLLTTDTPAAARALWEAEKYKDVRKIVEFTAMGKDYLPIQIYDTGIVELTPCHVDRDTSTVTGARCWLGVWKVQVLAIAPDPSGLKNTIKALLVEKQY